VPTFRMIIPGRVPGSSDIDEPHSGQKCLRIGLPLPPMLLNVLNVPSMVSASLGTRTNAAKTLPVNFWQSRQWHTVALVGSASAVKRTAPHRQPPEILAILLPSLRCHCERSETISYRLAPDRRDCFVAPLLRMAGLICPF